jgi:hypothetical protein
MNKHLRYLLLASLLLATAGFPGVTHAQDDGNGGGAPGGGRGGRGGRGRGNWQGGPPPDGSAPGGQHHHGPPGAAAPAGASASAKVSVGHISGEQFYIISSVDPAKQEVLLKRPTEVTLLMKVSDSTQYLDDTGKALRLLDLRAGDTVWVAGSAGAGEPMATRIRKGQMTVTDLHAHYLDYAAVK